MRKSCPNHALTIKYARTLTHYLKGVTTQIEKPKYTFEIHFGKYVKTILNNRIVAIDDKIFLYFLDKTLSIW